MNIIETFDDLLRPPFKSFQTRSFKTENSQQRRKQRIERHKLLTLQQYDLNMKNLIINNINDLTNTLRKTKIMKSYNDSSENIFDNQNARSENEEEDTSVNRLNESNKSNNVDEDEDEYVEETFEQTFVDVINTDSSPSLNRSNEKLFNINEEIHELFKQNEHKHTSQEKQTCNHSNLIIEEEENQEEDSERDEQDLNPKLNEYDERNIIINKDSVSSMSSVGIGSTSSSTSSLSIGSNNPSPNSTINKSFKKSLINNELFYSSSMFPYVYSPTNQSVQGMFCL
jgi:hypothetical protein